MIPYQQLFLAIKKLVYENRTGALFIATDSNRLAKIFFSGGKIVSVTLNNKNGLEACVELKSVNSGKVKFHEGLSNSKDATLPETVHILGILKPAGVAVQSSSDIKESDTAADKNMIKVVRDAFIAVIGPIGEMLFEENLAKSSGLGNLIDNLTKEMDSAEDIADFKARIQS